MESSTNKINPLSWEELKTIKFKESDKINGATNSYSSLRLFGQNESDVRVTLYRDNHAWCPYCQKIWLWLEFKQIPYQVKKVTMRCYGQKESWYLRKVPSGMLPAIELDGKIHRESDLILLKLEQIFGPLGSKLEEQVSMKLRYLERKLFKAWCLWLCTPFLNSKQDYIYQKQFEEIANEMEKELSVTKSPWIDPTSINSSQAIPGSLDIIFIPYLERMNASLAYYKGISIRNKYPAINAWFSAFEQTETYRGTQGDFHTHSHDLPPQMGGCWVNKTPDQKLYSNYIDSGKGLGEMETTWIYQTNTKEESPEKIALSRVLKHKDKILEINPLGKSEFDQPLRAALTNMIYKKSCQPNKYSAMGLRYLKDRISVPRDMTLLAARVFRRALEDTAKFDSLKDGPAIPIKNRFDQNPSNFITR